MSDLSNKNSSNGLSKQKMESYKNLLLKERKRILDRIQYLNNRFNVTSLRYEKKAIGDEIDVLEFELERVDQYLRNCFFDRNVMLDNIKSKKDEINELEYLLKTNKLPKELESSLLSKKIDLGNFMTESLLRNSFGRNNNATGGVEIVEVEKVVEVPKVIEVEKLVEVPKVIEVEKVIEVPTVVEVEKVIEVPKVETFEFERLVQIPTVQYVEKQVEVPKVEYVEKYITVPEIVEKTIEVEKIVEVPTLIGVDKVVEVPKIVEIDTNGNGAPIISSDEIASKINEKFDLLSQQLNDSLSITNQNVENKLVETQSRFIDLQNSIANIQPALTQPIYVETPVLIQAPYYENNYDEDDYQNDQYEEENIYQPPVVEERPVVEVPNVVEHQPVEVIQPVQPVVEPQPAPAPVGTTKIQQEVYEEVDDNYFDDDDDFDSIFE